MLASILLEVGILNLNNLLLPVPEPGAGEPDLLHGQHVDHLGGLVLQLCNCVTGSPVGVPFDRAT